MVKLIYNSNSLIKNTYYYIDEIKDDLISASRILKDVSIPTSFKYKCQLRNKANDLEEYYKIIDRLLEWLKKTNRELSECIDDFGREIDSIEVIAIKKRKS